MMKGKSLQDPSQKILQFYVQKKLYKSIDQTKMDKMCTITTKDHKNYQLPLYLLQKHSNFFQVMLEDATTHQLQLGHISSQAFDYVYEFLQLHKIDAPATVTKPIVKKIKLSSIMSEQDAQLMQRIQTQCTQLKLQIMNCAMYLQMESFKKILTYALIQSELETEANTIKMKGECENEIKREIEMRVTNLIEMQNHRKRLAEEDFKEFQGSNQW